MGAKLLFEELAFTIQPGERLALIGRNGVGKTTLFRILTGEDVDFSGAVERRRGLRVVATAQEHGAAADMTPLEYAIRETPDYERLKHIIETSPDTMGEDMEKIHDYTEALHTWHDRDYDGLEYRVLEALAAFGIELERAIGPLSALSGGEKRFVELVRVRFAEADLVLLDEPTNHMDAHGKAAFIEWLRGTDQAVFVITHDRDVLREMGTIMEIKEKRMHVFPGNYDAYLRQNSVSAVTRISSYEDGLKALARLHKQIQTAAARKAGSANNRAKLLEERLTREYDRIKRELDRPSIWIDRESVDLLHREVVEKYDRYKDKNIRIQQGTLQSHGQILLKVNDVAIGYGDAPLFRRASARLAFGDRLHIAGRNGAGKSTLIKTILAVCAEEEPEATIFEGAIIAGRGVRVGVYEQELAHEKLQLTLEQAVVKMHMERGIELDEQSLSRLLAQYLFDPREDRFLTLDRLSGGQKARVQMMRMLLGNPNLLVLDEPTNHLDLPSIEELEQALLRYEGAIIFVSHDSYFVETIGGTTLQIP